MALILASASPRRRELLKQIHISPDEICPAEIDEDPLKGELPRPYVKRVALNKARHIASDRPGDFVLAADTTVACGRRILPKAEDLDTAKTCLNFLSGRRHTVLGGIALIAPDGRKFYRLSETIVRFKRLSETDFAEYLHSNEWHGKAGGYAIQGLAAAYIQFIRGSYSNVVGLDLHLTRNLLQGSGYGQ